MKIRNFKTAGACVLSFFSCLSSFAGQLAKDDIRSIIIAGTNISPRRAQLIADRLEETYGQSENGQLKISGVLIGKRLNYGAFVDRKIWDFDASFIPEGTEQVITVPELVQAEFFNGGLKLNVISQEWAILFLPEHLKLEQLQGMETSRGFSFSAVAVGMTFLSLAHRASSLALGLLLPLWAIDATAGFSPSQEGAITLVTGSFGLKLPGPTFPKFKFSINPKYLAPVSNDSGETVLQIQL